MDPLLHPQDHELEAQLRRAGRDVSLTPAAQARLLAALGVTAGLTVAGEAAASTGLLGKLLASKLSLVAASMVSVGAIGAGVYFTQSTDAARDRSPVGPAESLRPATPVSEVEPKRTRAERDAEGVTAPTPAVVDKQAAQPRTSTRKPADAPAGLRDELALVEAVSRATKAGNGALALSHSLEYKRRFPRGKLALEAQVLHIEALALAGNRSEASRLAQSFLKRYPDSPVAARIRRFAH